MEIHQHVCWQLSPTRKTELTVEAHRLYVTLGPTLVGSRAIVTLECGTRLFKLPFTTPTTRARQEGGGLYGLPEPFATAGRESIISFTPTISMVVTSDMLN